MEVFEGKKAVSAADREEWRNWLNKNHLSESKVWLVIYHKKSGVPSVKIDEAMEEALCFGWIDSKAKKRDHESFYLSFSPRNPKSNWSNINKERAERMISQGMMTAAGQKMIDLAKETGTWDALNDVLNLVIPDDLKELFESNKTALKNFNAFSPSYRRMVLEWLRQAKRPETRQKRIEKIVETAERNLKTI
ncbi:MAG TPA: YdeI/OmpD-associated family protein [Bacteroidales bacterium]|nr:YdeI/OmpD-associated family protein [Bacteroidales bacterium]